RPDVLLGMGSYACAGPVMAALRLKVPVVLHEANVLPGKAISFFSRRAARVAGSFEETRFYMKRKDIVVTGMPLRSALEADPNAERSSEDRPFTILVMGGSRGAKRINEVCTEAIPSLVKRGLELSVVHLAGQADADAVGEAYAEADVSHTVHAFVHDMADIYRSADLAICRSGASTCAEISVFGVPALLVPYPYAARDHQMANARAMEKVGASDVVAEAELSTHWLEEYIEGCIRNPERLTRLSEAARGRTVGKASEALADLVEQAAGERMQSG
ncbi:MAG: UDP-N-acetylglucosamine--N-acetylmuramyl-(pentapeptide) pyrophosphoryl-undecaprenol N-acetylglucosamine transferase, partial [Verrucomicrobiota bacterium]